MSAIAIPRLRHAALLLVILAILSPLVFSARDDPLDNNPPATTPSDKITPPKITPPPSIDPSTSRPSTPIQGSLGTSAIEDPDPDDSDDITEPADGTPAPPADVFIKNKERQQRLAAEAASPDSATKNRKALPEPSIPTVSTIQQFIAAKKPKQEYETSLFTGAAGFTYGIEVPPGAGDLEPAITIQYNHHASSGRPGLLGAGWSISQNLIYRDVNNTLNDTRDDIFRISIDGVQDELVYVPSEQRYHTKTESYYHIQNIMEGRGAGPAPDRDPSTWIVKSPDGTTHRLGGLRASRLTSSVNTNILQWHLDRTQDTHGNTIDYAYYSPPPSGTIPDTGILYLEGISYNNGKNVINYSYTFNSYPAWESYSSGTLVRQSATLDAISVMHDNTPVRISQFSYDRLGHPTKTFLTRITLVGADRTSTLAPYQFDYYPTTPGWTSTNIAIPREATFTTPDQNDTGVRVLDLNGDGISDLMASKATPHATVWTGTREGWTAQQSFPNLITGGISDDSGRDQGVRFADFNKDGKIDILKLVSGEETTRELILNTGSSWIRQTDLNIPSEVSFTKKARATAFCNPSNCPSDTEEIGFTCQPGGCTRQCSKTTCAGTGTAVRSGPTYSPDWNDDDHDEEDQGDSYTPQPNKCYTFAFTGSSKEDSDNSDCYDLYTDKEWNARRTKKSYQYDCNGNDIDAYAGIGFLGNGEASSWLSTIPGSDTYGFTGNVPNSYWRNRFFTAYASDSAPDSSGSNAGDWDGMDYIICDQGGTHTISCAPTYGACQAWGKGNCGIACSGESTRPSITMGVYVDRAGNLSDALNDEWDCSGIDDNDYMGGGTYTVTEYEASTTRQDQTCDVPGFTYQDTGIRMEDLDGNGHPDFIKASPDGRKIWLGSAAGYAETNLFPLPEGIIFIDANGADQGITFADINGDSLPDLHQAINGNRKTWINTGAGWTPSTRTLPWDLKAGDTETGLSLLDVNTDGLADAVINDGSTRKTWINTGNGWTDDPAWMLPQEAILKNATVRILDKKGRGTPDIAKATGDTSTIWAHTSAEPPLLKTVRVPLGGTLSVQYKEMSGLDNTGGDGINDLGFSGWVVSETTAHNGMTGAASQQGTTIHNYSGGLLDPPTGEFRGFSRVTEQSPEGTEITHIFHQDTYRKGLEYQTELRGTIPGRPLQGPLYQRNNRVFSTTPLNGYTIVALAQTEEETHYESSEAGSEGQTLPKTTRETHTYDSYGNILSASYHGDTAITGDEYNTSTDYVVNPTAWIINKPSRTILQAGPSTYLETRYSYDSQPWYPGSRIDTGMTKGDITSISKEASDQIITTKKTYDSFGNVIIESDPNAHQTTFEYDPTGTFLIRSTNALGHSTIYTYDGGTGNILTTTDPNGFTTSSYYDTFGRKIKEVRPYDSVQSPTATITYAFDGNAPELILTTEKISQIPNSFNMIGKSAIYAYDGSGRLLQKKESATADEYSLVTYTYDRDGRLNTFTVPTFERPVEEGYTPPNGVESTAILYDHASRTKAMIFPDNTAVNYSYDLWTTKARDQNNHRTDYIKDSKGNIIEVLEHNEETPYQTRYSYSPTGDLTRIQDHYGHNFTFLYDTQGRLLETRDPDRGTITFTYDPAGNRLTTTDNKGNTIHYQYDDLNRVTSKGPIRYQYDRDLKGTLSLVGTLTNTSIPPGQYDFPVRFSHFSHYTHDNRYRVIRERSGSTLHPGPTLPYPSYEINRTYDGLDRVTSTTLPDGTLINYSYNPTGSIASIHGVVAITYNAAGKPLQKNTANGLTTSFAYDPSTMRLQQISTASGVDHSTIQDLRYSYDPAGNILGLHDIPNAIHSSYLYDNLDRITSSSRSQASPTGPASNQTIHYTYDAIGNLRAMEAPWLNRTYGFSSKPIHAPIRTTTGNQQLPSNLSISVGQTPLSSETINHTSASHARITGLHAQLNRHLADCTPDIKGYCTIPLILNTQSISELRLSGLFIATETHINEPPVFDPIISPIVTPGTKISIPSSANDPDGDDITFTLNDSRFSFIGNGFEYASSVLDRGTIYLNMTASDGSLETSLYLHVIFSCTPSWACTSYGQCLNNTQQRTCTDQNTCGNLSSQPNLTQSCTRCTENWTCGNWSACLGESQTRSCFDRNTCGATINRPALNQSCTPCVETWQCGNWSACQNDRQHRSCTEMNSCETPSAPPEQNRSCVSCKENWSCGNWSACLGGSQSRSCSDRNACGMPTNRPALNQSCTQCVEDWKCGDWSACINEGQSRSCTDQNACGTTLLKPALAKTCHNDCSKEHNNCQPYCEGSTRFESGSCIDNRCSYTNSNPFDDRCKVSWSAQLQPGPNLITIPMADPSMQTASQLATRSGSTYVASLNNNQFVPYIPNLSPDFTLSPGKGYLITVPKLTYLALTGWPYPAVTYTLTRGLNIVGLPFRNADFGTLDGAVKLFNATYIVSTQPDFSQGKTIFRIRNPRANTGFDSYTTPYDAYIIHVNETKSFTTTNSEYVRLSNQTLIPGSGPHDEGLDVLEKAGVRITR